MTSIRFIDILRLPDEALGKLKLVFNTNWTYTPESRPDEVRRLLGNEKKYLDLTELYRQGEVKLVKGSTRLHDPENKRFHNGELAFCFIPYGGEDWLLVNAFSVLDDSKKLIEVDEMADYAQYFGRLVITWEGRTTRNIRMKDIAKIEKLTVKTILEKPLNELTMKFPGYKNVAVSYAELKWDLEKSDEWKTYLKARKGDLFNFGCFEREALCRVGLWERRDLWSLENLYGERV